MELKWHNYKYYPYEKQLALREATALLNGKPREVEGGVEIGPQVQPENADRLVYFAQIHDKKVARQTVQGRLESASASSRNRQATRYSVHGLHEYKGKFNPQVAKAILNIFGVRRGDHVLDPFCGSGTTLVEAVQLGASATGFDINPLAVFLANAKLQALTTPVGELEEALTALRRHFARRKKWTAMLAYDERRLYLGEWFEEANLQAIEIVRAETERWCGPHAPIFLALASDLLRDYSLQDPRDLRIRRRSDPTPATPFVEEFCAKAETFLQKLSSSQLVLGTDLPRGAAVRMDVTQAGQAATVLFDAAITSPPYAMALPYIDTQRLSLVWLGLAEPSSLLRLESDLIGSRETRGASKKALAMSLQENAAGVPVEQLELCLALNRSLSESDGFRRKAVPTLLYRYFASMRNSFEAVGKRVKKDAPYALIVGHNHTTLGGTRFDIDTPRHLANLASQVGWDVDEFVDLQTYHRYGYHANNAVAAETMIFLRKT